MDAWVIAIIIFAVIIVIAIIIGIIIYFVVIPRKKTPAEEAENNFEEENQGETGPLPPEEIPSPVPPVNTCPIINGLSVCETLNINGNNYTIYPFIDKNFISRRDGGYISYFPSANGVAVLTDSPSAQWNYRRLAIYNSAIDSCLIGTAGPLVPNSVIFGGCNTTASDQFVFDGYNFYSYSGIVSGIALQLTFDRRIGFGLIGYRLSDIGTNIPGDIIVA